MVSLMGARRRAEQFASAVDGRTSVDDLPVELRELVDLATSMREIETPAPRPEFSASLREQLMAEAETALVPAAPLALRPRQRGTRERRLTAAAAVFTLVGGTAGMAAAAQDSLPGEALYPIKRGIEDAQLSFQSEAGSRGRSYLDQARERLDEAERLVDEDASSTAVAETVDAFVVQSVAGADLLLASYQDEQESDDVEVLREFAADATTGLQQLAEDAPADIQDELARAAVVLQRIDQQASSACAGCSDLPTLQMPALMAQAAEVSRAMEAMAAQEPGNDHPTVAVKLPQDSTRGQQRGSQAPSDDGGGTTGGSSGGVDVAGSLPRDPQQALEGLDRATGGLLGEVTSTTETTVEKTVEQAGKTAEQTSKTVQEPDKTVKKLQEDLENTLDSTVGGDDLLE